MVHLMNQLSFGAFFYNFIKKLEKLTYRKKTIVNYNLNGMEYTPSVSNYKTFQEFWRVKAISNLTKIIERNIKIYDIKLMYYKNITNKESNST